MNRFKSLEWIATGLSIVGALLNAYQNIEGFYVWCIANVIWVLLGFKKKMWGLVVTFIIFSIINILGILHWR